MATQNPARTATRTRRSEPRLTSPVDQTRPFDLRIRSFRRKTGKLIAEIRTPSQLKKEASAGFMIMTASLSVWVLWSGQDQGALVHWWARALDAGFGLGAFIVPVLLLLVAYRLLFVTDQPVLLIRHYAGGLLFAVASSGLIELAATEGHRELGGKFGLAVAGVVRGLAGDIGGGLMLFAIGALSVLLITSTSFKMLTADVRALLPRRTTPEPEPAPDAAPNTAQRPSMKEIPPLVEALPPPVINRQRMETRTASAGKGDKRPPAPVRPGEPMALPDVGKLKLYDEIKLDETELTAKARRIEETLASFKVEARVREINPGPTVTQYTLEPGVGIKVRKITELQNDLALALAAPSIRLEAPVPGQARVGIEIPNAKVATVGLRETLESLAFVSGNFKLPVPLGRDVNGAYIIHDLAKMPHLLIAGATGSGKSVCLTTIISTFLLTQSPDQLKMLMIDPKMVELTGYNGVPHLQCPVVTEMDKVVAALRLVLQEMERRYAYFSKLGVRNLDGYRMKMADEPNAEVVPYLVVIIDELADLMMTSPDDVESVLCRLAQMGRAAGIHLIIATQRPSVDVLTGLIKANVPTRVAFAVTSMTDSRVVLDMPGAERLLGRGDMLFMPPDAAKPTRVQGAFVDDKDVQFIVNHWHSVAPIPQYAQEWLNLPSSSAAAFEEDGEDDPLFEQAREIVKQQGTASASMLQRRLRIGYNRAARLIEEMEAEGLIGPADGIRGRPFLGGDY